MTEQLDFPFAFDHHHLATFLTRWCTIEDEQDRLREETRVLKAAYQDLLPMRALATAIKVIRARRKLAAHAKEPLALEHQAVLEALVAQHLDALDAECQVPEMF